MLFWPFCDYVAFFTKSFRIFYFRLRHKPLAWWLWSFLVPKKWMLALECIFDLQRFLDWYFVIYISVTVALSIRNYFPNQSGALFHTLSKLNYVFAGVVPLPQLRQCFALFAVAELWLLFDIGWFVLFFQVMVFL